MTRKEIAKAIEKAGAEHGFKVTFHAKGERNSDIYQTEVYDCMVIHSKESKSNIVIGFDDENKWDEEKVYITGETFIGAYAPELILGLMFDGKKIRNGYAMNMTVALTTYGIILPVER